MITATVPDADANKLRQMGDTLRDKSSDVVAVLSGVVMLAAETPSWSGILACAGALLYTGILSSAVGFTLQILGQQRLAPEPAALIMSLESVFAVLAGWLILGQKLSLPESIGCCLVFAAVILSQRQSGEKAAQ